MKIIKNVLSLEVILGAILTFVVRMIFWTWYPEAPFTPAETLFVLLFFVALIFAIRKIFGLIKRRNKKNEDA